MIDIDELEKLLEAATPGPWWICEDGEWLSGAEDSSADVGECDVSGADETMMLALRNAAPELLRELRETRQEIALKTERIARQDQLRQFSSAGERVMFVDTNAQVHARDEWREEDGDVLWWKFPVDEPPHVGSPLDYEFPDYFTHWTRVIVPRAP